MSRKVLIFDFDGTIINSLPELLRIFNTLALEYGYVGVTAEDIDILRNKGLGDIVDMLGLPKYRLFFFARKARKALNEAMPNLRPVQGIKEAFEAAAGAGRELVIITSNSADNVEKFLVTHSMNFFNKICAETTIFGKEHMIKKYIKNEGLALKDVIYIGDEVRDVEAAKRCGIKMVAVTWGVNSRHALEKHQPDFIIDQPQELLGIL